MINRDSAKACEMWVSDNNFNLTSRYADGNMVCDIATVITNESKTAVVYECKNNSKDNSINEGISQLIAYGLSLRHKGKFSYELKLVQISPRFWYLITLPPFDTDLPHRIEVFLYEIFCCNSETKSVFLCKNNYIQFLLQLRRHFQSFK